MHIAALAIYPVKGLRALDVTEAAVERCGLEHDRRWAVIRPDGRVFTQRDLPLMARIDAQIEPGGLRLECAGHGGTTAVAGNASVTLDIWRTKVAVQAANPEASAWLTRVLGTACTLTYLADPTARAVTPDLARPGDVVSLADGFPLLLTTTASLADLNGRLEVPVPMGRFRPNIVVDDAISFAEDGWSHIHAGSVQLRLASSCERCKVVTLDQMTGAAGARLEPLRTLTGYRRDERGRVVFGWNVVPETLGRLTVGSHVTATLHR